MVRADSWVGRLVRALAAEPPTSRHSRYDIIRALAAQPQSSSFPDRHKLADNAGTTARPRARRLASVWWAARPVWLLTVVVAAVVAGATTSGRSVLATGIAVLATLTLAGGVGALSARLPSGLLRHVLYRRLRMRRASRFVFTLLIGAVVAATLAVLLNTLLQ